MAGPPGPCGPVPPEATAITTATGLSSPTGAVPAPWPPSSLLAAVIAMLLLVPWSRRFVTGRAWRAVRHRISGILETHMHTRSGRLSLVLRIHPTEVGERAVRCRAGICFRGFRSPHTEIAVYARSRVEKSRRRAQLIIVRAPRHPRRAPRRLRPHAPQVQQPATPPTPPESGRRPRKRDAPGARNLPRGPSSNRRKERQTSWMTGRARAAATASGASPPDSLAVRRLRARTRTSRRPCHDPRRELPVAPLSIWHPIHLGTDETGRRVDD